MNQFSNTWNNLDLIFPDGGTFLDNVWYDNEEIKIMGLPTIETPILVPIRDSIASQSLVTWYDNGNMERVTLYNSYPPMMIDNFSPLNIFAQKIYNQFISNLDNNNEENIINDFECTYSSL